MIQHPYPTNKPKKYEKNPKSRNVKRRIESLSNELRKSSMKLRIKPGFQLVERTQDFPWDQ